MTNELSMPSYTKFSRDNETKRNKNAAEQMTWAWVTTLLPGYFDAVKK
jgi:hypothetical protein